MSEAVLGPYSDAAVRVRKERIHTTMLIELLALLVFMSMAFAFVMKEEGDRVNPWKEKHDKVAAELRQAERRIVELRREVLTLSAKTRQMEAYIRRLLAAHEGPLPSNDRLAPISREQYEDLMGKAGNDDAMLQELQRGNADLRAQLSAAKGGGTDLPKCLVTPGYLLSIELLAGGDYRVSPDWAAGAEDVVRQVPGAMELAAGGSFGRDRFLALAGQVAGWGKAQPVPCGFRVRVRENHGDLGLYKRQLRTVEQYFYVARR